MQCPFYFDRALKLRNNSESDGEGRRTAALALSVAVRPTLRYRRIADLLRLLSDRSRDRQMADHDGRRKVGSADRTRRKAKESRVLALLYVGGMTF